MRYAVDLKIKPILEFIDDTLEKITIKLDSHKYKNEGDRLYKLNIDSGKKNELKSSTETI